MDGLPPEIIFLIWEHLTIEVLVKFARISKKYHGLVNNPIFLCQYSRAYSLRDPFLTYKERVSFHQLVKSLFRQNKMSYFYRLTSNCHRHQLHPHQIVLTTDDESLNKIKKDLTNRGYQIEKQTNSLRITHPWWKNQEVLNLHLIT